MHLYRRGELMLKRSRAAASYVQCNANARAALAATLLLRLREHGRQNWCDVLKLTRMVMLKREAW